MNRQQIFDFQTNLSGVAIPEELNNPFGLSIPEIARIAAREFQAFIEAHSPEWEYDFHVQDGKMFGILVVEVAPESYGYLGTVSGRTPADGTCQKLVPSVFDHSVDDFFIDRGMRSLTEMSKEISASDDPAEISSLKKSRKLKSHALQKQLFENYHFLNVSGNEMNVVEIFERATQGKPPSAAGECAAPKLLQYAFKQGYRPMALAEFWWGNQPKNKERVHKIFYPACRPKCRPILEYMLDDDGLFERANESKR